jgi:hypothetical protein
MNKQQDDTMTTEYEHRYWRTDGKRLIWIDCPYDRFPDELEYEVEIINPAYTLAQIADGLDAASHGQYLADESTWEVCGFGVYRLAWQYETEDQLFPTLAETTLIAKLTYLSGTYGVRADHETPRSKSVRRMLGRGCDHPRTECLTARIGSGMP